MRVCLICEYFYPDDMGSTGTVLSQLARRLKDTHSDLEIDAITSGHLYRVENDRLPSFEDWQGIRIHRIRCPRTRRSSTAVRLLAGFWFTALVLLRLLIAQRYDAVFVVTNPPTLPMAAYWLRRLRGTPYVYLIHDLFPDVAIGLRHIQKRSRIARVAKRHQKKWLNAAAKVVVLGRCMRSYLANEYAVPEERMDVIPNWADPQKIHPVPPDDTRFRKSHNISGFEVLYAGNFGLYQSFDNILNAAKLLQDTNPNVAFAFVGDGAKKGYIEQFILENNIRNCRLFPFVPNDELGDMLGSANVCLVTLEEGMEGLGVPSKLYSILAAGKPVIAMLGPESEVACVIEESGCGIRVSYDRPEELAEAISKLESNPELAVRMGAASRQALVESFTFEAAAGKFYSAIADAAVAGKRSK